ncbi:MAG: NAD(P)-dependent oxidoreductase [bacterium]
MALHIENEANRCLTCKVPQCQKNCPISTPVPEVIKLFRENKVMEAGEMLFENNPLSVICSTVCNHENQCAGHCVLGRKGTPVQFYAIEHFISDSYLARMKVDKIPRKGKSVAVIGSGPSGLTVAILLAQQGYDVTIFERKNDIGGMLRYGIPDFRLPHTVLDRYKRLLAKLKVQVRLNTTIGGALTIEDLFRDGYATVFVGTGAWRPRTLNVQGESLANVHFGVSYLENPSHHDLGETVAIMGMGNVAMDVARTAFRHGAQSVTLFSRNMTSTASSHELSYAKLDGAELVFGKQIVRITPEGPVLRSSVLDENGNSVGVTGEEELFKADSVIIAISQRPKDKLLLTTEHLEGNVKGLLIVDDDYMTTREGVFSAGDVVTGPLTVVHAVEGAKKAAQAMAKYMDSLPA